MHDVRFFIIVSVIVFILYIVTGFNEYNTNRKPLTLASIILSIILAVWGVFLLT